MNRILAALALTAAMASAAFAEPAVRYYNSVPSSHAPAINSDPSARGFAPGDYVSRDPAIASQCLRIAANISSLTSFGTEAAASAKSSATRSASENKGLERYSHTAASFASSTP